MADKIDAELRDRLTETLRAGLSEEAMKGVTKAIEDITYKVECDLMYTVQDNLAPNLAGWCADMAQRAVEMMLAGNEDQMRRYLSVEKRGPDGGYIGWTGRSDVPSYGMRQREPHEWHPVIHGSLFEQGALALRKSIVDAHRDLLVNERILDLEDQVKSLVAQVNKANAEKEEMWQRVRDLQPA